MNIFEKFGIKRDKKSKNLTMMPNVSAAPITPGFSKGQYNTVPMANLQNNLRLSQPKMQPTFQAPRQTTGSILVGSLGGGALKGMGSVSSTLPRQQPTLQSPKRIAINVPSSDTFLSNSSGGAISNIRAIDNAGRSMPSIKQPTNAITGSTVKDTVGGISWIGGITKGIPAPQPKTQLHIYKGGVLPLSNNGSMSIRREELKMDAIGQSPRIAKGARIYEADAVGSTGLLESLRK